MSEERKVFEDFPQADCNTCRSYMLDQCDGVPIGESRKCTAYEATRHTDIPMQIEKLKSDMKTQYLLNILLSVAVCLLALGQLL